MTTACGERYVSSPFWQSRGRHETRDFCKEQFVIKRWNGHKVAREILLEASLGLFFKTAKVVIPGASTHLHHASHHDSLSGSGHHTPRCKRLLLPHTWTESENYVICWIPYYILDTSSYFLREWKKWGGREKMESDRKKKEFSKFLNLTIWWLAAIIWFYMKLY